MNLTGWLAALAVGLLAGGVSGLVGIGGGAIMVPFLYFIMDHPQLFGTAVPETHHAVVAHATSLVAIVPISIRGVWLYRRAGLVDWRSAWPVGAAAAVAAVLGARVAIALPGDFLKAAFGCFLLLAGLRLLKPGRATDAAGAARPPAFIVRALVGGVAVGFLSALLGVGGGIVAIPVLIYALRLRLETVSATSLAIIAMTATAGASTYAVLGLAEGRRVLGALGYVDASAAIGLALGALMAVRLGTRIQQRLSARALRWLFAGLFLLLGVRIAVANGLRLLGA